MLESNLPRNSRSQTHQDDETGAKRATASPRRKQKTHRIDRSAHASGNSSTLLLTTELWRASRRLGCRFGAPTSRSALEHMPMVQDAIEHRGDSRHVAQ
jgi:hypothetical protein